MINSNNITIDHTNLSGDLSSFINNSESVTLSQIHPYSDVSEYKLAVAKAKEYLDNKVYARVVCEKSSIDNDSLLLVPVILMKQAGKILVQSYSNRYPTVESRPVLGGNHQVGDLVYNTDVSNNKCLGWICIEEGIPGTWKEVGQARSWYNEIETLDYLPQPSELQLGRQILLNENNNSSLWICKLVGNSYKWTQQDYQVGTTADRPINPSEGYIRYNTDINSLEWWTKATGWESLISTAIIGGLVDEAMEEHKLEVDESLSNLSNELQEVGSQLEHNKKPKTINLGYIYKNYEEDASPVIRQLIEEGYSTIYLPEKVTLNTTLNLTNLDCINIIGCGRNEKGESATIIYCNTGGVAIDLVGSQNIKLSSFVMVNENLPNPSTVGILQGRSRENKWAQFNVLEHIKLRFSHLPNCNNGKGTIGLYNFKSELNTINNVYFFADNPCVFTVSNIFNIKSSFVNHDGEATIKSTSFIGITCLVSRYSHALILDGVTDMSFSNLYLQRYKTYPEETNYEEYAILVTAPEKALGVDGVDQYVDYQVNNITMSTFENEFYPGFIKIQAKCSNFMLKGQHTHGSGHIIHIEPNSISKQCSLTNSYININKSVYVDSQYLLYSDGSNYGFNNNIVHLNNSSYKCYSDTACNGNIFMNSSHDKLSELEANSKNLSISNKGDIYIGNRAIGYTWGKPTRTDLKIGTTLFNSYTDIGEPYSYVYTESGWINIGQLGYRTSDVSTITSTFIPRFVGEEVLAWDTKTWYKAVGTSAGEFKAMN